MSQRDLSRSHLNPIPIVPSHIPRSRMAMNGDTGFAYTILTVYVGFASILSARAVPNHLSRCAFPLFLICVVVEHQKWIFSAFAVYEVS